VYGVIKTESAMNKVLTTHNEAWGFFGTIRHHGDPTEAWPIAMRAIAEATGCSEIGVRDFLDSRHGRHFADDVANGLSEGRGLTHSSDVLPNRCRTIPRQTSR
jgi:hypothetical protein